MANKTINTSESDHRGQPLRMDSYRKYNTKTKKRQELNSQGPP